MKYKIWAGERLGFNIAIDTETEMFVGHNVPDIVTFQAYDGSEAYFVEIPDLFKFFTANKKSHFIAHNWAFDHDVCLKACKEVPLHDLLEGNQLHDTMILFRLYHLAIEGFVPFKSSLDHVADVLLNQKLSKNDDIRCNFAQFKGVKIEDIPEEFLQYAMEDARSTYNCYMRLMALISVLGSRTNLSENIQIAGAIALDHIYKRGIGFDLESAKVKLDELNLMLERYTRVLAQYGWVRGVKGIKDRYDEIVRLLGMNLPMTDSGNFSSKEEDLLPYRDEWFVQNYLGFIETEKLSTFIREHNTDRLHPRYNFLVNTGRTSSSSPNFQQLPRKGGIRELFVAKPGHTFLITDYSTVELCTLSQITYKMYGHSTMRDQINRGVDLHKYYAGVLLGKPASEITKDERQYAKAANFGFPGGLGTKTFIDYARASYGLKLTEIEAKRMRNKWLKAFPEMAHYLNDEKGSCTTLTGRIRGNTTYCAEKNTPFQGLAADGAKIAMYYLDHSGFDIVGFCHDEIISEVPVEKADELLKQQEKIMIDAMRLVVPDVTISVESQISGRYCK